MRTIIVSALLIMSAASASSQPTTDEMVVEVADNVSTEYVECAAFFTIVQGALAKSGSDVASQKYKETAAQAFRFALLSAERGRTKAMAESVTQARLQNDLRDMQRTIASNYSNISLLTSKYSDRCVEAMTNSEAVMKRWTERVAAKYQGGAKQ